jgi:DNA repair exonuclease SbcCD ATPase subunit
MSDEQRATLASFEVSNVMSIRLAALEFDDEGGVVRIGGDNGAGKSNLLKGLLWALGGPKALEKTDTPLRHGAEKGYVLVNIGGVDLQVRRAVTEKGTTFTVKDAEGRAVAKPQQVIDRILGEVGIDPSAILRMTAKELAEALREQCGLDLSDIDAEQKRVFEERTIVNRQIRDLDGRIAGMDHHPDTPKTEETVAELIAELDAARDRNDSNDQIRAKYDRMSDEVDGKVAELEKLVAQVKALEAEIVTDTGALEAMSKGLADLEDMETQAITNRIASIEETNAKVRANQARKEAQEQKRAEQINSEGLTEQLQDLDRQRTERVAAAKLPMDNLGFDADGELTLDGKLFTQASDGERIRAAFEIAVAAQPGLRLVVMRHGAFLDQANRSLVHQLAIEKGYLVLMEIVGDDAGTVEILVENGQVQQR